MRILAVHGIGHADAKRDWQDGWTQAITNGLRTWNTSLVPTIDFLPFDHLFERQPLNTSTVAAALTRLVGSGLFFGVTDLIAGRRGLASTLDDVRWTAGMVAQWVALEGLRAELRSHLSAKLRSFEPDVIVAHSLGTLIAYDTLRTVEVARRRGGSGGTQTLVTCGSQIGNAAVRSTFGGRVAGLEGLRFWWHLFNQEDDVFTAPISVPTQDGFRQVDTFFDVAGMADHDGALYLGHDQARATVWQDLAARHQGRALDTRTRVAKARVPLASPLATLHRRAAREAANRTPRKRALLVGIAEYPDATNALEGPVNDVFNVSSALQELGFDADDIRVVLNDRATTIAIRERLQWLLAEPRSGDQLVFFFAGHGAQIPGYGRDAEVDHVDECLVPYDFDWSRGQAITDEEFAALYGQLPYGAQFTAVLDCCHSGGMARAGGVRARGLTPPDDIRHRSVRWDKATQMWLPRKKLASSSRKRSVARRDDQEKWLGTGGAVRRMGRGTSLWSPTDAEYKKAALRLGHKGPYTPILLEACREGELAYEYRHGVTSYGAFTYALCKVLHEAAGAATRLTFSTLVAKVSERIALVVTEPQHPQLQCAKERQHQAIPGLVRTRARSSAK